MHVAGINFVIFTAQIAFTIEVGRGGRPYRSSLVTPLMTIVTIVISVTVVHVVVTAIQQRQQQ